MHKNYTTLFDTTIDDSNTLIGQAFIGGLFGAFLACVLLMTLEVIL